MRTYPCARCGKPSPLEKLISSRHTDKRYCAESRTCDNRIKRLKRNGAIFDRGFLVP